MSLTSAHTTTCRATQNTTSFPVNLQGHEPDAACPLCALRVTGFAGCPEDPSLHHVHSCLQVLHRGAILLCRGVQTPKEFCELADVVTGEIGRCVSHTNAPPILYWLVVLQNNLERDLNYFEHTAATYQRLADTLLLRRLESNEHREAHAAQLDSLMRNAWRCEWRAGALVHYRDATATMLHHVEAIIQSRQAKHQARVNATRVTMSHSLLQFNLLTREAYVLIGAQ